MPKNQESLNNDLFRLLQSRGYKPTMLDTSGKEIPVPEEAEVFQFHFIKDGEDYGTATVSIDGLHKLVVYFGDEIADSPKIDSNDSESWYHLLKQIKRFAQQHQLSFETRNMDKLEYDMAKRTHTKKLDEGYRAHGRKASVNDSIPTVKVKIQHNRDLEEGEQRFRNVAKIFLETSEGERILAPTLSPAIAGIYGRHLAEGGKPHDERWNHIGSMVEEYKKMAGFKRATHGKEFNESVQRVVNEGINHYNSLRETLQKLRGKKGYNSYFESWTPPLMEGDTEGNDLSEMFMNSSLDPRIECAMPILSKLSKNIAEASEMDEVATLESWANDVVEGSVTPSNPAQMDDLVKILNKEKLTLGADAQNIKNELDNVFSNDELFSELSREARANPDADAKEAVVNWLSKQNNPEYDRIVDKVNSAPATTDINGPEEPEQPEQPEQPQQPTNSSAPVPPMAEAQDPLSIPEEDDYLDPEEADYGHEYQKSATSAGEAVKRIEQKLGSVDIGALAKRLRSMETNQQTKESLGAEQKAVGQFGPTEKITKSNPTRGKLVGANESVDPVLARIRKLSGL
jgi:hypothetical protein